MVALEVEGDGEPLVLVHGLATTRMIWRRVVPLLRDGRRVIRVDVPGFGDSPPIGAGFALDDVAEAIAEAIPDDESFDLVGHSMGGAVALTLAARHPQRVRRLVLAAPAGLNPIAPNLSRAFGRGASFAIPIRRRAAGLADLGWGRRLLTMPGVIDPDALPPAEIRAMLAASGGTRIAEALSAAASADLRPKLRALPLPVGAIWGDRDRIVRPGGVDTVRALRPEAPVARIPDAGHIPMMERPHAFSAALEDVLSRLGNTEGATAA